MDSMINSDLVDFLSRYKITKYVGVEDFADRFNFIYTSIILLTCAVVVTIKQYLLRSIACYTKNTPAGEGTGDYIESYCWVHGTYDMDMSSKFDIEDQEKWNAIDRDRILYYQWVPFVLTLQCFMFYAPRLFWILFTSTSGVNLESLIQVATDAKDTQSQADRNQAANHVQHTLRWYLEHNREYRDNRWTKVRSRVRRIAPCAVISKRLATRLVIVYFLMKAGFLCNAVSQIFVMTRFLGFNTTNFGAQILNEIATGRNWHENLIFPRVTFCRVPIRNIGQKINHHMAQCVLPVNMLNEKIYILVWFLVLLAIIVMAGSIFIWLHRMIFLRPKCHFVKRFLKLAPGGQSDTIDKQWIHNFIQKYLRSDGMFILYMININAGDMICADITNSLFRHYKQKFGKRDLSRYAEDRSITNDSTLAPLEIEAIQVESPPSSVSNDISSAATEVDGATNDHELESGEFLRKMDVIALQFKEEVAQQFKDWQNVRKNQ